MEAILSIVLVYLCVSAFLVVAAVLAQRDVDRLREARLEPAVPQPPVSSEEPPFDRQPFDALIHHLRQNGLAEDAHKVQFLLNDLEWQSGASLSGALSDALADLLRRQPGLDATFHSGIQRCLAAVQESCSPTK